MRYDRTSTDRSDNFEKRLKKTMDSELEPEQVTPNTAGSEEADYDDKFPLIRQFRQTNMHPGGRKPRNSQSQAGRDND